MRIGLFGCGVVGGGFYELLRNFNQSAGSGEPILVTKICVQNIHKVRDIEISPSTSIVTNPDDILNDSEIDCIVEVIGGITLAKDIVFRAIQLNKHVVTANKALVATYLSEIMNLLHEHPTVHFAYEAAVCGGIPIINTLQTTYLCDNIHSIRGIMNGTTNFILSKMETEGANYQDVLREAQNLGYAEADPTADVEGFDVQAKISLLAKLAFGMTPTLNSIMTQGITSLTSDDFQFAKSQDWTIKLLGSALNHPIDGLIVYVTPTLIPKSSPIGQTNGPYNIIIIESNNLQKSIFIGPGAGRYPTANSVLSDVIRIARNQCSSPFPKSLQFTISSRYNSRFYVRITFSPLLSSHRIDELMSEIQNNIKEKQFPIHSFHHHELSIYLITDIVSNQEVKEFTDQIQLKLLSQDITSSSLLLLPILIIE